MPPAPEPLKSKPFDRGGHIPVTPWSTGERPGGLRAWWQTHERFLAIFYSLPPFVSVLEPNQHNEFLADKSFMARDRARKAMARTASMFDDLLNRPEYCVPALARFKGLTQQGREDFFLQTVAREMQMIEQQPGGFKVQLKLVPEFTLAGVCGDGGEGFARILDNIRSSVRGIIDESAPCVPNKDFFTKFGLEGSSTVPHSRGNRAFQDEMVLVRHNMLFHLVCALLQGLVSPSLLPQ